MLKENPSPYTGAGFIPAASSRQPCFGMSYDIVALHLNPQGRLADATLLGRAQAPVTGMRVPADGSVLLASYGDGGAVLSQVRFGDPGWTAAPASPGRPQCRELLLRQPDRPARRTREPDRLRNWPGRRSGLSISVALWLYSPEHEDWRFVLASRRLDTAEPSHLAYPRPNGPPALRGLGGHLRTPDLNG